ncbi:MAG: ATPase [Desulfobacterales bacterium S5133MH4]|nr:MAG: ATPase [Desulfobacterales bacterium S5133MH4]
METIRRFFDPPRESFFLFGPRGTGKSTLVNERFKEALYIDLLDPETFRTFSAHPERLRERLLAAPDKRAVVIDEIQKVPQLLSLIHSLIEKKAGWQFVLTGSSSRKLKRAGVDLLAGRALLRSLHPFMAAELGDRFNFDTALQKGLLPLVLDSPDPGQVLQSYAALYLREEVQMEGVVRNVGNFSRFLEAISFSHASLLNISNVARECEVERKVVEGYVSILEDLLLSYRLQVFTKRAKRALVAHPKFYLFDAGVYRSLRPKGPLDRPEEIDGHALEGLVAQHLRAWIAYSKGDFSLHFWRTRSGVEVDFVVYGSEGLFAMEVKNSARIHPQDLRPLKAFKQDYPESKVYLLYRGKERLVKGDILCVPCGEFLEELRPGTEVDNGGGRSHGNQSGRPLAPKSQQGKR